MPTKPKSPRRRAKQGRSQVTVDAIITAAALVIEKEGYSRATTDRIAERAGVSVGSVYQYFGNKDEIYKQLIAREATRSIDAMRRIREDVNRTPQERLNAFIELGVTDGQLLSGTFRELQRLPQFAVQLQKIGDDIRAEYSLLIAAVRPDFDEQKAQDIGNLIVRCGEGIAQAPTNPWHSRLIKDFEVMVSEYVFRQS